MKRVRGGARESESVVEASGLFVESVDEQDAYADAVSGSEGGQDRVADKESAEPESWAFVSMASRPNSTAGTGFGALRRTLPGRSACSTATADSV